MSGAAGGFIVTRTGRRFCFDDPAGFDYAVDDIAPALANLCRFVGQAGWWSVAQHSLLVGDIVASWGYPQHKLRAVLHDASEAFLADIPTPLKQTEAFSAYRSLERTVMDAINGTFGLPERDPEGERIVKKADRTALRAEAEMLGILDDSWEVWDEERVGVPARLVWLSRGCAAGTLAAEMERGRRRR